MNTINIRQLKRELEAVSEYKNTSTIEIENLKKDTRDILDKPKVIELAAMTKAEFLDLPAADRNTLIFKVLKALIREVNDE